MFLDDGFFLQLSDDHWTPFPDTEGRLAIRGKLGLTLPGVDCYAEMVEIQPGTIFPEHTHEYDHTIHILQGPCLVGLGYRETLHQSGDTVYVPPHVVHRFRPVDSAITVLIVGHPQNSPGIWSRIWSWLKRWRE